MELRRTKGVSCVIISGSDVLCYERRGIADLHILLHTHPEILHRCVIADKVVGKGAAALMVAGGVAEVFSEVMSRPAAKLLDEHNIKYGCDTLVDNIINRTQTGLCPVESICCELHTIGEMIESIDSFVAKQHDNNN